MGIERLLKERTQTSLATSSAALTFKNYYPALDGLRGLCILCILIFHHITFSLGFLAMDMFFVLSGFLITGILVDTKNKEHFFKIFFIRRFLRIVPLYYAFLGLFFFVLPALFFSDGLPEFEFYFENELSFWLYLQNITMIEMNRQQSHAIAHLWSLALEEQYYIIIPFVVSFFSRKNLNYVFILVVLTALIFRIHNVLNNGRWIIEYFHTISRMDSLAIGGIVALLIRSDTWNTIRKYGYWLNLAFLILIFYFVFFALNTDYLIPSNGFLVRTVNYSIAGFMFGLLLLMVIQKNRFYTRVFSVKLLTYFGKRSYAIYIFHYPVKYILVPFLMGRIEFLSGFNRWQTILLSISTSILIAEVSWRVLEQPFLRLKKYFQYENSNKELVENVSVKK